MNEYLGNVAEKAIRLGQRLGYEVGYGLLASPGTVAGLINRDALKHRVNVMAWDATFGREPCLVERWSLLLLSETAREVAYRRIKDALDEHRRKVGRSS